MIKVAVVGFGFMGMTHTLNIFRNPDIELVAIVDKDLDGIEDKLLNPEGNFSTSAIDPGDIQKVKKYRELSSCLENEPLDAVHVCVHTDQHFAVAHEVLLSGKHVLLEKPFSLDIKECRTLIDLASARDKILMVAHVVRFMAPYLKLRSWIQDKQYGELEFLSMTRHSGVPLWGQWKEKQTAFGSSGGALFDLLIHDIDYVNFVLGKPSTIKSTILPGKLSNYDYISAWWEYPDMQVKIEGGNTFHSSFPFQAGFMAKFEEASALYTTLEPDYIQVSDDAANTRLPLDQEDGFYNEIDYFKNCLLSNSKPALCTPESAMESIQLCYEHLK